MKVGFLDDWRHTAGEMEVRVLEGTPPTSVPRLIRLAALLICGKTHKEKETNVSHTMNLNDELNCES